MSEKLGPFIDWEKPAWNECFMGVAYLIAMMSPDPNTKNGAIIVDEHKHIRALGFNGFPPGCDDRTMPLTRPDKYSVIEHAERNAINNSAVDVGGMTMYVTGHPCKDCFRTIACNRIAEIIYDPNNQAACVTDDDLKFIELMNRDGPACKMDLGPDIQYYKIRLIPFDGDFSICMKRAMEYYEIKQRNSR